LSQLAYVWNVAYSPDGKRLATVQMVLTPPMDELGTRVVQVWDLETKKQLFKLAELNGRRITDLVFSPNSQLLACRTYPSVVRIWDVSTGQLLYHSDTKLPFDFNLFAFSADSRLLLIYAGHPGERFHDAKVFRVGVADGTGALLPGSIGGT